MSAQQDNEARDIILRSIRSHLAGSVPHDAREAASHPVVQHAKAVTPPGNGETQTLPELFKESLEAVDGHCVIVHDDDDLARQMTRIMLALQRTDLRAKRVVLSDNPEVERLVRMMDLDIDELAIAPAAAELFGFDVGITTAQAAIAETGTLVLDAESERHRLVSLVPPVHIAIVRAESIFLTLGEALSKLHKAEVSSAITFVTGPSRTADIELTLAIGVHGPRELYVIIRD